jgi:succinate-semialdehyde dehydrogenase/glutarate-semialdehyde dehydrogenase
MSLTSHNPATGEVLETFDELTDAAIEERLARAASAFEHQRRSSFAERAGRMSAAADILEREKGDLGRMMTLEMGKPIAAAVSEVEKCAWVCRYYAEHAESFLADEPRASDGSQAYVRFDPLGPILAIMPWNFPFWQAFRFAAPALAAGNTILLKHAPNTPQCGVAIEKLFLDAGLPEGLLQNLFLTNEQAARLVADERLRGVTLTGSTRAGREVARIGGRHLKAMVMELGGSDPFIVLDDADLTEAIKVGADARCLNSGQSCIAAKRFLVHTSVFDQFRDGLVAEMSGRMMGDPKDRGVNIGPMARKDLRDKLAAQVQASIAGGARALCGGRVPDVKGFFYPPTVLVDVAEGTPAAEEELFGPVAPIIPFASDDEAVALANGTAYGLGASLWTADAGRARQLIGRIDAGAVFVNGLVKSDPRLPFGGVKDSGFGRELSREGMHSFVNIKTVWIR